MKFLKNFFFIILILSINPSFAQSEDKIVYLDLDSVVSNTKAGKSIISNLEKSKKKHYQNLKKKKMN